MVRQIQLAIFLWGIASATIAGEYNEVIDIGASMPSFENLPNATGEALSSKDIDESIVVLVSLANHCPWVKGMDPDLVLLSNDLKDKDVRFVAFSVNHREDDRLPAMKEHAKKNNYDFAYLFDESQQLGRQLGATRTPEYFVFNKERKLVYMGAIYDSPARKRSDGSIKHIKGEPKEHYVRDAITATLAGKAIKTTETRAHGCSVKYL